MSSLKDLKPGLGLFGALGTIAGSGALQRYNELLTTRVRNVKGTADLTCPCGSWLDHHERFTRSHTELCSAYGCTNRAFVGGHVIVIHSGDIRRFIVPLCYVCNGNQAAYDLKPGAQPVPANVSLTCGR